MKKNFAMRIAACLLVVTMLSLCMVSYTYAKYTTGGKHQNSAQVANWGVKVNVALSDLFAAEYDAADVTVKASGSYNLLAPGTTKTTAAAVKIEGQPEVSTEIIPVVTVELDNWVVDGNYYCPIIFKVNDVAVATADNADDYEANIKAAIEKAIKGKNADGKYDPNSPDLAHVVNVTWEWPFETGGTPDEKAANNIKDTVLGDAATKATFTLNIVVTINQVD